MPRIPYDLLCLMSKVNPNIWLKISMPMSRVIPFSLIHIQYLHYSRLSGEKYCSFWHQQVFYTEAKAVLFIGLNQKSDLFRVVILCKSTL